MAEAATTVFSNGQLIAKAARLLNGKALSGPDREALQQIVDDGFICEEHGDCEADLDAERARVAEILQSHGRLY